MARLGQTIGLLAQANKLALSRQKNARTVLQHIEGFGANPGGLTMLVHLPTTLRPRAPLVVVLHGCTQNAEGYARGAGWIEAADRLGFALLCPEQTPSNNPNLCFNWFAPGDIRRGGGEAASIAQMTQHMVSLYGMDPDAVFVTGLSAGGAMANVMLATHPEMFKGGAIIAGLPYGSAGNVQEAFAAMAHNRLEDSRVLGDRVRAASGAHKGPWPSVSVWHGDGDATVSPAAGDAVARQWANVHGVGLAQPVEMSGRREWRSPAGDVVVEHRRIAGMGHGTPLLTTGPGAVGVKGPYLLEAGVSSTLEILKAWGFEIGASATAADPAAAQPTLIPAEVTPPETKLPGIKPVSVLPRYRAPAKPGAIDVGEVINKALRAAGLMK